MREGAEHTEKHRFRMFRGRWDRKSNRHLIEYAKLLPGEQQAAASAVFVLRIWANSHRGKAERAAMMCGVIVCTIVTVLHISDYARIRIYV